MPIPMEHVVTTCLPGSPTCCRYLMMDKEGFVCAKLEPETKAYLDKRVANHSMNAIGDNCEGILNAKRG